jgi:WXG100 family type VII secretion target
MTGFDVTHGALAQARGATAEATERLRHDRSRLDAAVVGMLTGGWHGSAAESFRDCWDAWLGGARDVVAGLDAMGSLLAATHHDYEQRDDGSEGRLSQVAGRLVERLG